ncbi:MAG: hypothetical protein K2M86_04505 [Odoribacter sp.]|nr:hypothetical protein [Odoribacter sp.]
MKTNYKHIFLRTKQMLLQPAAAWSEAWKENATTGSVSRNYLLPIAIILSVIIFLLQLIHHTPLQAFGLGVTHFLTIMGGAWATYRIVREYLCNKLIYSDSDALNLTVYSYTIFIVFHCIGETLGNIFIGQMFTLLSFIFLRTLYTGIGQLPQLQANHKTNILIITSLSIVCLPIIITQILRILFRIPAIHI